jgi:hypothetical protein
LASGSEAVGARGFVKGIIPIKVIQRLLSDVLPPDTYELVHKAVQAAQADPATRERVRGTFAALRGQLQSATNQEQVIAELLRVLPTKTGPVN